MRIHIVPTPKPYIKNTELNIGLPSFTSTTVERSTTTPRLPYFFFDYADVVVVVDEY